MLQHGEEITCNLPVTIEKENQMIRHVRLPVTSNVVGYQWS